MTGIHRLRVLIVEDEAPVSFMLEDLLEDLGCCIAGSVARVSQAWEALGSVQFDFAILDVNLAGENSFDLARAFVERNIPFAFSTGYGASGLPVDLQNQHVLTKPFSEHDLLQILESLCR